MTADDVDRTPRFQFEEEPFGEIATWASEGFWGLAGLTALLGLVTGLALRRYRVAA